MRTLFVFFLCSLLLACSSQQTKPSPTIANQTIEVLLEQRLITSGQPTIEDLNRLQAEGVTTIISLRTETENSGFDEASEVTSRGMRFISMPISGKTDITSKKAEELNHILEQTDGKVLLHCASGNRVGAMVALIANTQGDSPEQALHLGKQAGLGSLQTTVEPLLQTKCENC